MYYRGGGLAGRSQRGLNGLGLTDAERFQQNARAETLARNWDRDALRYLKARTGQYGTEVFPVPGPSYEPNGGPISGWATQSARADADARLQKTLTFLAFQAPDPVDSGPVTTGPASGGGSAQPLPEVTILGAPNESGGLWLIAAGVAGLWLYSRGT